MIITIRSDLVAIAELAAPSIFARREKNYTALRPASSLHVSSVCAAGYFSAPEITSATLRCQLVTTMGHLLRLILRVG